MKTLVIAAISAISLAPAAQAGASFDQVWGQVASDAYDTLPHYQVTFLSIGGFLGGKAREAARATLSTDDDLRPPYEKVVHPNGLCLAGHWRITEDSPYTGYFGKDKDGLIIVRASAATGSTKRGERRAFGFAGKIFPTTNPADQVRTGNFFTVDDLGGLLTDHYLDTELTNQPKTSTPPFSELAVSVIILKAFESVDSNATMRQVYPVSELGVTEGQAKTPHWLKIRAHAGQQTADDADFRDELRSELALNGGHLLFDILVAGPGDGTPDWKQIGVIDLDQGVASRSCDQSLHFPHPVWRTNLVEP